MDELQKQKQMHDVIQTQKQEEAAPQHMMKHLEQWNTAPGADLSVVKGQYLEQTLALQQQYNEQLTEHIQQAVPQHQVNQAAPAPNPPVQEQAARETYKQRRERQKKIKKAQKACPVGDEYTLDMAKQIHQLDTGKNNAMSRYLDHARADQLRADKRALKVFSHGFRTDKHGNPLPEDAQYAQQDQAFVADYLSGDLERRRPHLERITQEMISMRLTPDIFSAENLTRHPERLKEMTDKMVYFENLQKENPAFFDQIPQVQKEMLAKLQPLFLMFTNAFAQHMDARGINYNQGTVYGHGFSAPIQQGLQNRDMAEQLYQNALQQFAQDSREVLEQEADRRIQHYEEENQAGNDEMVQTIREEAGDMQDIEFTSNVTFYQYEDLNKYRKMITDHPEQYQANKPLLDAVYQEYYRMLDISGNMVYKMRAMQAGIDDIPFNAPQLERAIKQAISNKQEALLKQKDILDIRTSSLADIMEHILRNKPLSPGAAVTIQEFNRQAAPEPDEPS